MSKSSRSGRQWGGRRYVTGESRASPLPGPCALLEGAQDPRQDRCGPLLPGLGAWGRRCLRRASCSRLYASSRRTPQRQRRAALRTTSACRPRGAPASSVQLQSFSIPVPAHDTQNLRRRQPPNGHVVDEVAVPVLLGAVVGAMRGADQPPLAQRLPAGSPASSTVWYSRRCTRCPLCAAPSRCAATGPLPSAASARAEAPAAARADRP